MAYSVSWVDPSRVSDEHLGVWERNLQLPMPARARFEWLYRGNPAGPGRLAVLHAGAGPDCPVVGTAGYGRRVLQVAGQPMVAAVLSDLAVDRAHRSAMPAIMLAREMRAEVLAHRDLVYAFPNANADRLMRKLGYRLLAETRRFVLVLRHGPHVNEPLRNRLGDEWAQRAAPLAGLVLDATRAALIAARAAPAALAHRLEFIAAPDARFDRLWETARHDYDIVGVRDAAFVKWRFLDRPEGPLQLAAMFARATGELSGFAAIARDGSVAHIRDVFAARAAVAPLLSLLSARLALEGMASISLRLCGAPGLVAAIEALGFRERPDRRAVVVDAGAPIGDKGERIAESLRWYLTDADEDA